MRILAIHRYFWPDTPPYASMLRAIASRWAADGHSVEVLSTQPSYKKGVRIDRQPANELLDGFAVHRVDLPPEHGGVLTRLVNAIRFAWAIVRQASRSGPYDVIMASTAPPVIVAATARFAAGLTGARMIYHCMDIHPEIGRITGQLRNPLVYGILYAIDAWTCRGASRVVVLSSDMSRAIQRRESADVKAVQIINNFSLPVYGDDDASLPASLAKRAGIFRILFAGNIGRFQGLETVIDAMREIDSSVPLELLLMGEGSAMEDLKLRSGRLLGDRVRFAEHQPVAVARKAIRTADVCLVILRPRVCRFAFPSKTMTYLEEGRPLLVSVERESELAKFVERTGVGTVVGSGDSAELVSAITEMVSNPDRLSRMARLAKGVAEREFDMNAALDQWSDLLKDFAEQQDAAH
ncbi:MAG: glycosyltransferase family 4 protein [Thermoanaerobaculia bacterium]